MKKYIAWNVPVHDEFLKLAYLTEEEKNILDSWCEGKCVVQQSFLFNVSESTVKNVRKSIINKYKDVMPYSTTLKNAWKK